MQDDTSLGAQIKSESPIGALQGKLVNNCDKRMDTSAYWLSTGTGGNVVVNPGGGGVTGGGGVIGVGNANINGSVVVGPTDGGFINSQPSMAEFMTHLDPDSPKMVGNQGYGVVSGDQMDGVPEYPWMKEKKTARKNSNSSQGKSHPLPQKSKFSYQSIAEQNTTNHS